jgi:hypothetical protein
MNASPAAVAAATAALSARLKAAAAAGGLPSPAPATAPTACVPPGPGTEAVVLRLCRQYPGDIGVFAPYFLNLVRQY